MATSELRFNLDIPADRYLAYYHGKARWVIAHAADGRTVRFPAVLLREVVGHDGVHGEFAMEVDADNRFVALRRLR